MLKMSECGKAVLNFEFVNENLNCYFKQKRQTATCAYGTIDFPMTKKL